MCCFEAFNVAGIFSTVLSPVANRIFLAKLKGLELKMTYSHFIKFEFSPAMHVALNSSQPVLHIFWQRTA